jgi:hypothetical protein
MKKIMILIVTVCCYTLLGCDSGGTIVKAGNITCQLVTKNGIIEARFHNNNAYTCIVSAEVALQTKDGKRNKGVIVGDRVEPGKSVQVQVPDSRLTVREMKFAKAKDYDLGKSSIIKITSEKR